MLSNFNYKHRKLIITIAYLLFFLYLGIAATLLFWSPYRQAVSSTGNADYNLVPFHTIASYIQASGLVDTSILVTNLAGNVLAFMPLGFFLPLLFTRCVKFRWTILVVFLTTLAAECLQFLFRVGSFDIDDIILNTIGGALGFTIFKLCALWLQSLLRQKKH
ncbi:VanZ family protein [Bacillus sp. FJAT-27251]|uniref:VanZ family protein n=1 Tax=Bacillus sp. FJAT-27251 TaxID=1684142 RepID=UPI0006A7B28C|nr:VanZ family protein [Bacillus sp. FJAT-27251]